MAIIVEDGSIVTGANSYVTTAELTNYGTARGVTLATDAEQLLIKAMDYIEALNYKGIKQLMTQPLQWPRVYVVIDGYYLNANTIPQQLKNGLMECAIAIDQNTDPLRNAPILVSREKVDVIEVEYSPGSPQYEVNRRIKNALWKLLAAGGNSSNVIGVSKG